MALSSDRAGRKPPRRPPRASVPPPAPPMGDTGTPDSVGLAPLGPPPDRSAGVPIHEPPIRAADTPTPPDAVPEPSVVAGPASPDASTVQSIPLIPDGTGTACPTAELPVPGEEAHGTQGQAAAGEPPAAGTGTPPPARTGSPRYGYLIFLFLLLALAGALYYLLFRPSSVAGTPKHTLSGGFTTAWSRVSGWLARTVPDSAATNPPPAGQTRMPAGPRPQALKKTRPDAAAPAASPFLRTIRQARQAAADVLETRAALPPEVQKSPPGDAPTNGSTATAAAKPPAEGSRLPPVQPRPQDAGVPATPVAPAAPTNAAVEWPEVEVTAAVGGGRRGSAIVNGDLLVVGEENEEGLLLDRIEPQTAVLRYHGETRRFTVKRRE